MVCSHDKKNIYIYFNNYLSLFIVIYLFTNNESILALIILFGIHDQMRCLTPTAHFRIASGLCLKKKGAAKPSG